MYIIKLQQVRGQDADGKWWEHFEVALALYVKCVEILREIAPVDVVH